MGLFDQTLASDALEDLLERERSAVLEGRFDVLHRLGSEKERLVQAVARDGSALDVLARLRKTSERNGELLEAMRAGVAAAQRRISAMRNSDGALQTYDSSGRKRAISGARKAIGHRA